MAPVLLDYLSIKKWLFFIPHPDDEALGCGGLLALLNKAGAAVKIILITDGGGAATEMSDLVQVRRMEFNNSIGILGYNEAEYWCERDGELEYSESLRSKLRCAIIENKPNIVVAPWFKDEHPDHSVIGAFTKEICEYLHINVLFYEVWGNFKATHLVDITSVIEIKEKSIMAHGTGISFGNYRNGFIGLAAYRSIYLPYYNGCPSYAEAYYALSYNDL